MASTTFKVIEDNTSYTTVKHLWEEDKGYQFPIPPLKEQQRIVNILDDAFANINLSLTKLQQKIPSYWNYFRVILIAYLIPKMSIGMNIL